MNKIIKLSILTIVGILFTCVLYQSYHNDNLFRHFFYLILGGIGFSIYYQELFNNSGEYKGFALFKKSMIIIIGTLLIVINIGILCFYEFKINSKTLIKAENHGVYADFKENGSYIIRSGSWASKKHFYGKYTIEDSLVLVDQKCFDDILGTNKFVIRKMIDTQEKLKYSLVELDANGKEMQNGYSFEIVEDNRK